jgi:hypothetical protein
MRRVDALEARSKQAINQDGPKPSQIQHGGRINAADFNKTLADFDKRRMAQTHKLLIPIAQRIAAASEVSDDELRTLDAMLKGSGITRQQFADILAIVVGYERRPIVTAAEQDAAGRNLDAAQIRLEGIQAERSKLPPLSQHEARRRWFEGRDAAIADVHAAEAAIKRLQSLKTQAATIERRHADLLSTMEVKC